MKFCAAVVLYNPNNEQLNHIKNYKEIFEYIYIFDNTECVHHQKQNEMFFLGDNFHYFGENVNNGMSIALNYLCEHSRKDGYEYCCLLDQDSFFSSDNIAAMFSMISTYKGKVGVFAPNIIYKHKLRTCIKSHLLEDVSCVITSGSFINLRAFHSIGGFDNYFFIDRLEHDYCQRLLSSDFRVLKYHGAHLYQELGRCRIFLGLSFFEHEPLRNYYIFRNRIYFYIFKSNENLLRGLSKLLLSSVRHVLKIILLESNKYAKLKYIYRALIDSLTGKFGKYQ